MYIQSLILGEGYIGNQVPLARSGGCAHPLRLVHNLPVGATRCAVYGAGV